MRRYRSAVAALATYVTNHPSVTIEVTGLKL